MAIALAGTAREVGDVCASGEAHGVPHRLLPVVS